MRVAIETLTKFYIKKREKNTKIIEVVGRQWVASRRTYRIGKELSAAAADDFCDCPKMAYLGTGCGKKWAGSSKSASALQTKSLWGEKNLLSKSSLHRCSLTETKSPSEFKKWRKKI